MSNNNSIPRQKRNSSIELLRLLFMEFVFVHHVYLHGYMDNYDSIFNLATSPDTIIHSVLFFYTKIAVTGFIFISGYYGIKMSLSKWLNFLFLLLFYALLLSFATGFNIVKAKMLYHCFDWWWFISGYMVVCLVAPFIETAINTIHRDTFRNIALAFLLLNYFAHMSFNDHTAVFLLSVYVIARYIKTYSPAFIMHYYIIIGVTCTILFVGFPIVGIFLGLNFNQITKWYSANNILILGICCSLVLFASKHYMYNKYINWMASSAIAIYLITDYEYIRVYLYPRLLEPVLNGYGFIYILLISLICILIDKIRVNIFVFIKALLGLGT